jgi:hypothetical protein
LRRAAPPARSTLAKATTASTARRWPVLLFLTAFLGFQVSARRLSIVARR